jgi:hypothetical protein
MSQEDSPALSNNEFEAETIRRALAGDAHAGREALRICCAGLFAGSLSRAMTDYLAERLLLVDQALSLAEELRKVKTSSGSVRSARDSVIAEALCINRPPRRPRNPLPDWQKPYAVLGVLLIKAGMKKADAKRAMMDARMRLEKRSLDPSDAGKILAAYTAMAHLDEELLLHLLGDLRKELPTYLPRKKEP